MRRAAGVMIGLLAAGCLRQAAGPTYDFDGEADLEEARAFCERWNQLGTQNTPQAALERARLAIGGLPTNVADALPCLNRRQLLEKGAADAERAAKELATDPQAWLVLAAYRARLAGNPRAAADAACRGAELAPRSAAAAEACGVYLGQSGDAAGSVKALRQALLASADREQQFELIGLIERTSPTPKADLESLPADLVELYRASQREQAAHAHRFGGFGH